MGLSSTLNRVVALGDGSSAVFPFSYYFFNQSDLVVYTTDTVTLLPTLKVLNTDYTISGTVNSQGLYTSGANVVMNSSPNATTKVVIFRNPSEVQNYALLQNGPISSAALVQQMDYLTMLIQRLEDQANRSLSLSDGFATTFSTTLPNIAPLNPGASIVINSTGTGIDIGSSNLFQGAAGFVLTGNGPTLPASFQSLSLSGSSFAGILAITNGGTGTGTQFTKGSVIFTGSAGIYAQSNSQFFWDNTNNRLGIGTAAPDSLLNVSGVPTPWTAPANSILHVSGVDGNQARFVLDAVGSSVSGGAGIFIRRAQGTSLLPSGVKSGNTLGFLGALGYGSSGFAAGTTGTLSFKAAQDWTDTSQGTSAHISVVANSSTTATQRLLLDQDGSLTLSKYSDGVSVFGSSGLKISITGTSGFVLTANTSGPPSFQAATGGGGFSSITMTGDVIGTGSSSIVTTIVGSSVTNQKLAQMPTLTIKGNSSASTAQAVDLTVAQVNAMLGSLSNPMTTGGDIIVGSSGGAPVRLPNGNSGQVLTSGGGVLQPSWSSLSLAGSSSILSVSTKTANYTAVPTDGLIIAASGCGIVNLYSVSGNTGRQITIKKTDSSSNQCVVIGSSATIDGSSIILGVQYEEVTAACDGTNWHVINRVIPTIGFKWWVGSAAISGAGATISWRTPEFDTHSIMSGSTGLATINRAGKWKLVCSINYVFTGVLGSGYSSSLLKNGAQRDLVQRTAFTSQTQDNITLADELLLNVGDTVGILGANSNTSPTINGGSSNSWISMIFLGP